MDSPDIVRSDHLRGENRRRVLSALRCKGASSPTRLSEVTGLSAAAISSLTTELADDGVVQCTRPKSADNIAQRGRPQSLIGLNGASGDVITLNIAIDMISASLIDYAGKLKHTQAVDVESRQLSESALLKLCIDAIRQLIDQFPENPVHHIGVAFQGVTENNSGTLKWSPIIQLKNVPLKQRLLETFKLPVSVNNDCHLICEALSQSHEKLLGSSFAAVLFCHGVGLGLYINGKPFSGIHSSALEMGHLRFERNGAVCRCGKQGCIEAYAADYGICRLAAGQSIQDEPFGRLEKSQISDLCEAAENKDQAAIEAFAIAGAAIGEGLATVFALFDAMPVAVVGRSKRSMTLMQPGVDSAFRDQLGDEIAIGTLLHCFSDADPLLDSGLTHNTLTQADQHFAFGK